MLIPSNLNAGFFNLLPLKLFILSLYKFPSSSAYMFNSKSCWALVG
nr:MAG TPA: hypothetical protein [Caudoviricetes sp.]